MSMSIHRMMVDQIAPRFTGLLSYVGRSSTCPKFFRVVPATYSQTLSPTPSG